MKSLKDDYFQARKLAIEAAEKFAQSISGPKIPARRELPKGYRYPTPEEHEKLTAATIEIDRLRSLIKSAEGVCNIQLTLLENWSIMTRIVFVEYSI